MAEGFFGAAEVPDIPDAAAPSGITVATLLTPDVPGTVDMQFRVPSTLPTALGWRIYRVSDHALLASGAWPLAGLTPGTMAVLPLGQPIPAGVQVAAAVWTDRYTATHGYFAAPITRGHLAAPADAGVFDDGGDGFPVPSYLASCYFVGFVFTPSGATLAISGAASSTSAAAGALVGTGPTVWPISGAAASVSHARGTLGGRSTPASAIVAGVPRRGWDVTSISPRRWAVRGAYRGWAAGAPGRQP